MFHQVLGLKAGFIRVAGATSSGGGAVVYITHNCGRGAISHVSTRVFVYGGRVSKLRTASLAGASARSFPHILVCALILCRAMR